jgi:hypothetical protein
MSIFRGRNREFASEWKAPATALEEREQTMAPFPHHPPSPSDIASSSSSSSSSSRSGTESVLEIAIYMHGFHNLDLFQQGYVSLPSRTFDSSDFIQKILIRIRDFPTLRNFLFQEKLEYLETPIELLR